MFPHSFAPYLLLTAGFWLAADDPALPYKRMLNKEDAKRVAALQDQIATLTAEVKFAEAQKPAEEVLQMRLAAQGKDHWETVDARFTVVMLSTASKQSAADQAAFAEALKLRKEASALRKRGRHAQAQPMFAKVLAVYVKVLGEEHPETALVYNLLGFSTQALGKYAEAQPLFEKALAIRQKTLGEEHPDTITGYNNVAYILTARGKPVQAQPLLEKALANRRKVLGDEHEDTAASYNNLAYIFNVMGKPAQAQPLFERALIIRRKVLGDEHEDTASSYNNVAYILDAQGMHKEAQPLFEKALAIRRKVLGEEHTDTAESYDNLAFNLNAQGKHTVAQPLHEKGLAIQRKVLGDRHPVTAHHHENLATNLNEQGKYKEAQQHYEKALEIRRQALGENHPKTALSYNTVAMNLNSQGRYREARPLFEKGLTIRRHVFGEDHPDTAASYSNLAANLNAQGKPAEAQPLLEKALAIRLELLGETHPDTARSYNGLAFVLSRQGRYAEAQPLFERFLASCCKIMGDEHPMTATAYNNLASNLHAQGRFKEAGMCFEKSLVFRRKVLGEDHLDTATTYNNLAMTLGDQGKHTEARTYHDKALAIHRKVLGETHQDVAVSYSNAALNLERLNRYADAHAYHERALAIRREVLSDAHPDTGVSYHNLAANLNVQGKYAEAQQHLEKAVAILRDALGDAHPLTAACYQRLGLNLHAQGKTREAIAYWRSACQALDRARLHVADTGFERALYRADWLSPHAALAAALAESHEPGEAWGHAEAFLARGLLDDLDPASRKVIETPARLAQVAEQLVPLLSRSDLSPEERERRDALRKERDELRKAQSEAAAERAAKRVWSLDKIQSSLPGDAALVLWLDGDKSHWACLVKPQGQPIWQQLSGTGTDRAWNESDEMLAQRAYESLIEPSHAERDKLLQALRAQRLDPILPHLAGIRHLLVVPVGEMAKVPIEALSDQFTISYTPSASVFGRLRQQHRPLEGRSLLALGNPAFLPSARDDMQRSEPYTGLPGTQVEVEALARLVPESKILLGSTANEQTLEQLAESGQLKQYRLLHFATHGEVNESIPTESALILAQDQIPHKSGGLLTRTLAHKKPIDGRLTVGTILKKWELDADQVVLSACETGLGTQAGGEGLLGFAQALLQKGAKTVVLSRWKVPDAATSLLMQRYYANILGKRDGLKSPMPRAEGLREAKHWLRSLTQAEIAKQVAAMPGGSELRGSVKTRLPGEGVKPTATAPPFAAPYYWAAFVLIGDPS